MLNALKIGLLALMPLSVTQIDNTWTLTPTEATSKLQATYEYLYSNGLLANTLLSYNDIDFTRSEGNDVDLDGFVGYSNSSVNYSIRWYSLIPSDYTSNMSNEYSFCIIGSSSEYIAFEHNLIIKGSSSWDSSNNEGLTQALEQDIGEVNEMPSVSDIFSQVTSSITAFIGSLGNAFTSVTSLFYANGQFTFLGVLILIGVGVGLVYGAYRLIKGLLHRV